MAKKTPVQRRDRGLKYLLYGTIFLLGTAAGIAIRHYYNIPMIESINIIDVATLIVTIFLAVYIPGVFDRQMEVRQDKKELIEHRIGDLQEQLRQVDRQVQRGQLSEKERELLMNSLEVAANRFGTIITLFDYLGLDDTFTDDTSRIRDLLSSLCDLLNKARLRDGDYSGEVRREEERLYNEIDKQTSLLVFRISDI
ncbi:MAG: hypothetical protein LUF87_01455 [Alistipes sp.]|nr:hypothetical protein [Alistipes sp.]